MNWLERTIKQADFSRETDLKDRLARRLFENQTHELDDEDLEMLAAAGSAEDASEREMSQRVEDNE